MLPAGNWGHSTPVRSPPASESASRSGLFKSRRSTLMSRHVGPRRGASTWDRGRPAIERGQDALDPGASARNSPPTPTFEKPWRPGPASPTTAPCRARSPLAPRPAPSPAPAPDPLPRFGRVTFATGTPAPVQSRFAARRPLRLDRFKRRNPLAGNRFELLAQRLRIVGDELRAVARAGGLHVEALLRGAVGVVRLHLDPHTNPTLGVDQAGGAPRRQDRRAEG